MHFRSHTHKAKVPCTHRGISKRSIRRKTRSAGDGAAGRQRAAGLEPRIRQRPHVTVVERDVKEVRRIRRAPERLRVLQYVL